MGIGVYHKPFMVVGVVVALVVVVMVVVVVVVTKEVMVFVLVNMEKAQKTVRGQWFSNPKHSLYIFAPYMGIGHICSS